VNGVRGRVASTPLLASPRAVRWRSAQRCIGVRGVRAPLIPRRKEFFSLPFPLSPDRGFWGAPNATLSLFSRTPFHLRASRTIKIIAVRSTQSLDHAPKPSAAEEGKPPPPSPLPQNRERQNPLAPPPLAAVSRSLAHPDSRPLSLSQKPNPKHNPIDHRPRRRRALRRRAPLHPVGPRGARPAHPPGPGGGAAHGRQQRAVHRHGRDRRPGSGRAR
jgi:hypothetical protein